MEKIYFRGSDEYGKGMLNRLCEMVGVDPSSISYSGTCGLLCTTPGGKIEMLSDNDGGFSEYLLKKAGYNEMVVEVRVLLRNPEESEEIEEGDEL